MIALFAIILTSLFIYMKILNLNPLRVGIFKAICGIILSGALTLVVFYLRATMPYARYALMILTLSVFSGAITHTKTHTSVTANIIAVGISYGTYLITIFISTSFVHLALGLRNDFIAALISVIMQGTLILTFFRIKRFRKGIIFLNKTKVNLIGLIVCGMIILIFTSINSGIYMETGTWFLVGTSLCLIGLISWWRHGITRLYRARIKERNAQEYEKIIEERDAQIRLLREDNETMAKMIHRDNKMLQAMREAVALSMRGEINESSSLLTQINQLMEERTGVITKAQRENKEIPPTKDIVLDGIMNHMLKKAADEGIEFNIVATDDITELTSSTITPLDLETLFADLIENAIIATSRSEYRQVLITFGTVGGVHELTVQDSGQPFEVETLMNLGKKRASTHLDDGGSGIGYMAIFEILRKCNASITITEYPPQLHGFIKAVSIRFDGKNAYAVQTHRVDEFGEAGSEDGLPMLLLP